LNTLLHFQLKKELEDILGSEWVRDADVDIHPLIVDTWWATRMLEKNNLPLPKSEFVVQPAIAKEVSALLRIAQLYRIPIIPRGGSASDTAGSFALDRGIVLDMRRMNRVIDLDTTSQVVTVQAGIMMSDLEQILNAQGFTTNHLPASMYCSTVGGFLSTRGSGVLSSKYGKIEDLLLSAEVALPDGSVLRTCPVPRSSAGPQLSRLFVGAEGIFGVFTEITLQMFQLPEKRAFPAFAFKSLDDAFTAGRKIMTSGLKPAVMRVYDEADSRKMVQPVLGDVGTFEGLLVLGFDGTAEFVDLEVKIASEMCRSAGGTSIGEELGSKWWNHRYDFYYPPHTLESSSYMYAVTYTLARYREAPGLYRDLKHTLETKFAEHELEFVAHFSHWYEWGMSIYPNFIVRCPPEDPYEGYSLFIEIWRTAVEVMHRHNGTINEHHGTGFKLGRFYRDLEPERFELVRKVKTALDPKNILSPGMFGLEV